MSFLYDSELRNKIGVDNGKVIVPAGWVAVNELKDIIAEDPAEMSLESTFDHLPFAAKRAEQLIHALAEIPGIVIPEAYLKIVADSSFHLMLLVSEEDYHSPQLIAARMIANRFMDEEEVDIRVTFSILIEHIRSSHVVDDHYLLKHVEQAVTYRPGHYTTSMW